MPSVASKRPALRGFADLSSSDESMEMLPPPPKRSRRARPVAEEESSEHEVESRPRSIRQRFTRRSHEADTSVRAKKDRGRGRARQPPSDHEDCDDEDEMESEEETTKARSLDKFGSSAVSESHTRLSIRTVDLENTLNTSGGASRQDPKPTRIRRKDLLSEANATAPIKDSNMWTSDSNFNRQHTKSAQPSATTSSSGQASSSTNGTSAQSSPSTSSSSTSTSSSSTSTSSSSTSASSSSTSTSASSTSTSPSTANSTSSDGPPPPGAPTPGPTPPIPPSDVTNGPMPLQYIPGFVHRPHYRYKAGDLDGTSKQVILRTCREYEALILSVDAFPDSVKQRVWLQQCFAGACRSMGVNFVFDDRLRSMVVGRGSRIRGNMLKIVRGKVASEYKFRLSTRCIAVRKNLKKAENLKKDNGYLYQNDKTLVGYCRSKLVPIILQEALFGSDSTSFGVVYRRYFDPIPLPTLALVYSMINHCIIEWSSGNRVTANFTEEDVKIKNYQAHLKLVSDWSSDEPGTTRNMRVRWYRKIRALAGIEDTTQPTITLSAAARMKAREELSKHTGDTSTDEDVDDEDEEEDEGSA
ncbi:hypothetical protein K525DRAFT_207171 [Schizophyllum commune Loenen D]|nr:hypothetical protein K525DRAFT_207171 [Schizophyllum commune Loenen D]